MNRKNYKWGKQYLIQECFFITVSLPSVGPSCPAGGTKPFSSGKETYMKSNEVVKYIEDK